MGRSRTELRFKALAIIVGGDVGQVPSAEDANTLDAYIDDAIAELSAKNVVYIGDPDDIPNELFSNLAKYVADAAAEEFGGKSDEGRKRYYENQLRVIARQIPGYGPAKASYF